MTFQVGDMIRHKFDLKFFGVIVEVKERVGTTDIKSVKVAWFLKGEDLVSWIYTSSLFKVE